MEACNILDAGPACFVRRNTNAPALQALHQEYSAMDDRIAHMTHVRCQVQKSIPTTPFTHTGATRTNAPPASVIFIAIDRISSVEEPSDGVGRIARNLEVQDPDDASFLPISFARSIPFDNT